MVRSGLLLLLLATAMLFHSCCSCLLFSRVLVKFIIGERSCHIHPTDRVDEFSCTESAGMQTRNTTGKHTHPTHFLFFFLFFFSVTGQSIKAHDVPAGLNGEHHFSGPVGMDFQANSWVVVSQLAAFDSGGDGFHRTVRVSLWCLTTKQVLVSETFSRTDPGQLVGGLRYKPIQPLFLPKVCNMHDTFSAIMI